MARFAMDVQAEEAQPGVTLPRVGVTFAATPKRMEEAACAKAEELLIEGQIGIYAETTSGPFLGYAIRYKGEAAYFEPAENCEPAEDEAAA